MRLKATCRKAWNAELLKKVVITHRRAVQNKAPPTTEDNTDDKPEERSTSAPSLPPCEPAPMEVDPPEMHLPEPGPSRQPTVEDAEDEDDGHQPRSECQYHEWVESFPPEYAAGKDYGTGEIPFEDIREQQQSEGGSQ